MPRIPSVLIDWNDSIDNFTPHIHSEINSRILLSAPFGSGKSTFLQKFFEGQVECFVPITLFPVNYAIASTQDVFELIKFDLLTEIIVHHQDKLTSIMPEDFSLALRTHAYLQSQDGLSAFVKTIVSETGNIGKSAITVLESLNKLKLNFKQFSKRVSATNQYILEDYIKEFKNRRGSAYEMDDISNIITRCLDDIRNHNEKLKTVLVIEDLDRLDPEHIFRLFNIFSAHLGQDGIENKFGFDKVVFVCDIENIRKMYEHKYGAGVDFTGYMNKFYSTEPFEFRSRLFLHRKIGELLNGNPWYMDESLKSRYSGGQFRAMLKQILTAMIIEGKCTLRTLDQAPRYYLDSSKTLTANYGNASRYRAFFFDFFILIEYLRTLFPNVNTLKSNLKILAEKYSAEHQPGDERVNSNDNLQMYIASICLEFILPPKQIFTDEMTAGNPVYSRLFDGVYIRYQFSTSGTSPLYNKPRVLKLTATQDDHDKVNVNLNVFKTVYEAFTSCIENGYIQS